MCLSLTPPTDFGKFFNVFLLRLSLGYLLILLGLGYLFQPKTILRFNAFMREYLFKDAYVLLDARRIGMALLLLGLLLWLITFRMIH